MNNTAWFLLLASTLGLAAADWPQFRGPQASGVDATRAACTTWDCEKGTHVRWESEILGLAHSSPIIWRNTIYVTTTQNPGKAILKVGLYGDIDSANDQQPHEWRLIALDKDTGNVLWNKVGHQGIPRVKRHTKASHCNSTPATDGQRIVTIFGSEGLFCFDRQGELIWKKDLGPMNSGYYSVPTAEWGFASSPVLHAGNVIVLCDVQTNSFLAVFDLKDGKEIWRTPRRDVPTWGSPTVVAVANHAQILVNGWHHSGAYDFQTGKEIWRFTNGGDIPVPTPVVESGIAYFTSGHGRFRPMRAISLAAKGDITPLEVGATNASIIWAHARQGTYMQTPIVVGSHVYGCLDNGILTCFDAKSGSVLYSERLGSGSEGFTSSPISDGRHLYFASEGGNVFVVPVDSKFSITATNKLNQTCMASPAIADGVLYFGTRERLIAIGE